MKKYTLDYTCSNCDQAVKLEIDFGVMAPEKGAICTNCGCKTCSRLRKLAIKEMPHTIYPSIVAKDTVLPCPSNSWEGVHGCSAVR